MKKRIAMVLAVLAMLCCMLIFGGCGNKQVIDVTYSFERAIIELPNGEIIEGKVSSWKDYDDGDQIQVKINGKTYLVHSSDIVLISE